MFSEQATTRGLVYSGYDGSISPWGFGVIFSDLDDVGDPDVVAVGRSDFVVGIFENDGSGNFIDRSLSSGILPVDRQSAVVAGDYDGDALPDLYLVRYGQQNRLYRNLGGFQFQLRPFAGVDDLGRGLGCCWGDYDGDGLLDIHVANHTGEGGSTEGNTLYRNLGDGTFLDVTALVGVTNSHFTFQSVFFDMDRDGDADLYVGNGKGPGGYVANNLYENVGAGVLVDRTGVSGTEAYIDSMGIGVGDLDGNGYPDLYCTNIPFGNPLFLNQGNGTFVESSATAGVAAFHFGWSAQFLDFDRDARLDLHVCNWSTTDLLYRNPGVLPCDQVADAVGFGVGQLSTVSSTADVDLDGDVDVLIVPSYGPLKLYINEDPDPRNWLEVRLRSEACDNVHAVGATIDVTAASVTQTRGVRAGEGYKGQNELVQHFGLDDSEVVDSILVTWPGGATTTVLAVPANRRVTVTPTGIEMPEFVRGDANIDGGVDIADVIQTLGHLFFGLAVSCRVALDSNADLEIDISDPVTVLAHLFTGGAALPPPFPGCGSDTGAALALDCRRSNCP
ncbi:MAG: CRTAC1 family protein [Planctomycetes bacterium]|nr:CRTAC1 family protein [Planctomycetota bacterium]